MNFDIDLKGAGDRVDSDIVVGRPDASGGEQLVVAHPKRIFRFDYGVAVIGDHAYFPQPDPLHIQPGRDLRDILVLGSAGQNLVSDHDQRGGPDTFGYGHEAGHSV